MENNRGQQRQVHYDVTNVGLRAQATAVGFVQLCVELRRSNVIDDPALSRIKKAIADELAVAPYRRHASRSDRAYIDTVLDRLFAGETKVEPLVVSHQ